MAGRRDRVTSGVAYNCSATQFLVPGVASSSAPKRFGNRNIASCVLRLSRKYVRNIILCNFLAKKTEQSMELDTFGDCVISFLDYLIYYD